MGHTVRIVRNGLSCVMKQCAECVGTATPAQLLPQGKRKTLTVLKFWKELSLAGRI